MTSPSAARPIVRVLVVDDNRDTMLTLGILLRSEGYIVRLAQSGAEALLAAALFRPEVALLDLQMPDRSGCDVAQELYRRYGSECPVLIAVTGHKDRNHREQAEISGFHHFVEKPYDPEALLRLLDSITAPASVDPSRSS